MWTVLLSAVGDTFTHAFVVGFEWHIQITFFKAVSYFQKAVAHESGIAGQGIGIQTFFFIGDKSIV